VIAFSDARGGAVGEVELFVSAEHMLAEVMGRIRQADRRIVAGPVLDQPGWDARAPLHEWAARWVDDDMKITARLGGTPPATADDPAAVVDAACAAARTAVGDTDFLWEATALRCFLAHDVAMALGSRACPLPEDLARGMFEHTEPDAARWRESGVFRDRLPLPPGHVSWRDQFLLLAGRDPHPFL
jgi:hypothetical protein